MTPYEGLMNDEETAAVLTFIRNSWGNKAAPISPEQVNQIREAHKDQKGFYKPQEL
jgi:mono/diheme cytochrome c family protein